MRSSAGEAYLAAWDANFASGELPLCNVQNVAVNASIHQGVRGSWKKESWARFSSGRFVASIATPGFSGSRSPTPPAAAARQLPIKLSLSG